MAVKPFGDYAECYAALYRDKNYAGEARFVSRILRRFGAKKAALLELGCGTGSYTRLLARDYERTVGVDLSASMLEQAARLHADSPRRSGAKISYQQGDLRTLDLPGKFDVAVSLFHVMSYQIENSDLLQAFTSVNRHLKNEGIFLFDFWYGPGVLSSPPERRVKQVETDELEIVRKTVPQLDSRRNTVQVNFEINLRRKQTGQSRTFRETHHMRYLFLPELEELCARTGFEVLETGGWLTRKKPELQDWNAYLVARKVRNPKPRL